MARRTSGRPFALAIGKRTDRACRTMCCRVSVECCVRIHHKETPLPGILHSMSINSLAASFPIDGRQSPTALAVARGTTRLLHSLGLSVVSELALASGRRADLVAIGASGDIWIVEIKSSVADFRADQKWMDYRRHCDRLFFATTLDVPCENLSARHRPHRGRRFRRIDPLRGAGTSAACIDPPDRAASLRSCGGAAPLGARRSGWSDRDGALISAVSGRAISARAWPECAAACAGAC